MTGHTWNDGYNHDYRGILLLSLRSIVGNYIIDRIVRSYIKFVGQEVLFSHN